MNEKLIIKEDGRGKLVEIFKFSNPITGQIFFSTSKPGVIRGNHYHTRKTEYFCVIEGLGKISLRNRVTNEVKEYIVSGEAPEIVKMTINWTHNIQNIGDKEMKLLVWANEVFNVYDSDTFAEEV